MAENLDLDFLLRGRTQNASEPASSSAGDARHAAESDGAAEPVDLAFLKRNLPQTPHDWFELALQPESSAAEPTFDISEDALEILETSLEEEEASEEPEPEVPDPALPAPEGHEAPPEPTKFQGLDENLDEPLILPPEPTVGHDDTDLDLTGLYDLELEPAMPDLEAEESEPDATSPAEKTDLPEPEFNLQPEASGPHASAGPEAIELADSTAPAAPTQTERRDEESAVRRGGARAPARRRVSWGSLFGGTKLIGLDIGTTSVKYAVLQKTMRGLRLLGCGSRPLPREVSDDQEALQTAMAESLSEHFKLHRYSEALVTTSVSGLKLVYHNVQVPESAKKELSKAIPWACRKDLPFPPESTQFEFKVLQHSEAPEGKLDVFVVAAPKGVIEEHLRLLEAARIEPTKISTIPAALTQLAKAKEKKPEDRCVAVLDIGGESSHIAFINRGELQFAREIATAGNDFTEALCGSIFVDGREITVSRKRAEEIKRKYGFLQKAASKHTREGIPLQEIAVMMGPVLERMAKEVRRTIEYYREHFGAACPSRIYLTGGGSYIKLLSVRLARELECEVENLDPLDLVSAKKIANLRDLEEVSQRFAVAIGLAMDQGRELNLLPAALKRRQAVPMLKRIFGMTALALVALIVLLTTNVRQRLSQLENELARLNAEYVTAKPKREKFLALQQQVVGLKRIRDDYRARIDVEFHAAEHMKAISQLIPRNVTLTSFRVFRRQRGQEGQEGVSLEEIVRLDGVAFQRHALEGVNLARFLLALEGSRYFYSVALTHQRITEAGNLEFSIECTL